jgi:hypothetical protein
MGIIWLCMLAVRGKKLITTVIIAICIAIIFIKKWAKILQNRDNLPLYASYTSGKSGSQSSVLLLFL